MYFTSDGYVQPIWSDTNLLPSRNLFQLEYEADRLDD